VIPFDELIWALGLDSDESLEQFLIDAIQQRFINVQLALKIEKNENKL
jgi:hypothetical protein